MFSIICRLDLAVPIRRQDIEPRQKSDLAQPLIPIISQFDQPLTDLIPQTLTLIQLSTHQPASQLIIDLLVNIVRLVNDVDCTPQPIEFIPG
jgi:hypothetical protein